MSKRFQQDAGGAGAPGEHGCLRAIRMEMFSRVTIVVMMAMMAMGYGACHSPAPAPTNDEAGAIPTCRAPEPSCSSGGAVDYPTVIEAARSQCEASFVKAVMASKSLDDLEPLIQSMIECELNSFGCTFGAQTISCNDLEHYSCEFVDDSVICTGPSGASETVRFPLPTTESVQAVTVPTKTCQDRGDDLFIWGTCQAAFAVAMTFITTQCVSAATAAFVAGGPIGAAIAFAGCMVPRTIPPALALALCAMRTCAGQGLECCPPACVDISSDDKNCGGCGVVCASGEHCLSGECGCGFAGRHCPAGSVCIGVECVCSAGASALSAGGVCEPTTWTGTASVEAIVDRGFEIERHHVHADVTFTPAPGDATGTMFVATGTATYSATGTRFLCPVELLPTTLPVIGELRFFPAMLPPAYLAFGGVSANLPVDYVVTCPGGSPMVSSEPAGPWLETQLETAPLDATTIAGTVTSLGMGMTSITFVWSFTRNPPPPPSATAGNVPDSR